jgi:hypothetical protein
VDVKVFWSQMNQLTIACSGPIVLFVAALSLALTTGLIFLSFWIGWIIQLGAFTRENSPLAGGYNQLFAIPAVADAWPVFSCFLYGFLILKAVAIVVGIVLFCCCGCTVACCGFGSSNSSESFPMMGHHSHPSVANWGTFERVRVAHS